MNPEWITCPLCGHTFDASEHLACQACPLNKGCPLLCCPSCGFEMVNVHKSTLAQWISGWLLRKSSKTGNQIDSRSRLTKNDISR